MQQPRNHIIECKNDFIRFSKLHNIINWKGAYGVHCTGQLFKEQVTQKGKFCYHLLTTTWVVSNL